MPKKHRLRRREFPRRHARRAVGEYFSLSLSPLPGASESKFSCVVSKKIAKRAVDRNKLKRRCREIFRPLLSRIKQASVVVYPKKAALSASHASVREEAREILGKIAL